MCNTLRQNTGIVVVISAKYTHMQQLLGQSYCFNTDLIHDLRNNIATHGKNEIYYLQCKILLYLSLNVINNIKPKTSSIFWKIFT